MARKTRSTLFWVLVISLGAHLVVGLVLGGWTIYKYTKPPEATFASPPPAPRPSPRNAEYQVQMQQLQRRSTRPTNQVRSQTSTLLQRNMSALTPGNSPSLVPTTGSGPIVTSAAGPRGARLGGGSLGLGVSAVDFFGIKKQGERVVFIVDVAASMVERKRGDLSGFERVKQELVAMVEKLSPGTFFNVITFERAVDVYAAQLVLADDDSKNKVAEWIQPYWALKGTKIVQRGTFRDNYQPDMSGFPSDGGSSRLDLALVAALEMKPDLIFMITDGTPSTQRGLDGAELAQWERERAQAQRARDQWEESATGQKEMAAYEEARAAITSDNKRRAEARTARGLPPEVREGGSSGLRVRRPGPSIPGRPTSYYTVGEIASYAKNKARIIYGSNRADQPSLNIVGYSASPEAERNIDVFTRAFPDSTSRNIGAFEAY